MHKAEPYAWSLYISWRTRARQDTTPQEPVGQTSAFRGLFDLVACGGLATQCHSFFRLRVGIAFRTSLFQFWARALRLGNLAPCPQIARGLERRRLRFGSLQQATR
jgi:hypothetical protein